MGRNGKSTGASVAALMRREMSPAEAYLITRTWRMPPAAPPPSAQG